MYKVFLFSFPFNIGISPWLCVRDSYGEDIAETDSDDSISFDVDGSEDDEYESDFIDDGDDIEMCPASAPRKSGGNICFSCKRKLS